MSNFLIFRVNIRNYSKKEIVRCTDMSLKGHLQMWGELLMMG